MRFYAAIGVSAILAGLLVWQSVRVSRLRTDAAKERAAAQVEQTRRLDQQAVQLLRACGEMLGWAIADPLAANDLRAVDERIRPLVREQPIMVIAVADDSKKIRIATNHKLEGQTLGQAFPAVGGLGPDIAVTHTDAGIVVVVPISKESQPIGWAAIYFEHLH